MKSLKSIFKHSDRRKESSPSPSATSSHIEKRLGPAQLLDEHGRSERGTSSDQSREPRSHAQSSAPSSHANPAYAKNDSRSIQQAASISRDRSAGEAGYAAQSNNLSEREDDSIGDDYRAYLGAISPGSAGSKNSTDAEFFSLGSDRRLRTGDSEMKHNEDIADRNIEYHRTNSSRNSSLKSQDSISHLAQNHNLRRRSIAASVGSLGSVPSSSPSRSAVGLASSTKPKYSLGTGIPTEGGLIDSILPHVDDPHAPPYDRKHWPSRIARNEADLSSQHDRGGSDDGETAINSAIKKRGNTVDLRRAILAGPDGYDIRAAVDGVVDLNDTEDTDRDVQWAPAVTQEVVKPHVHEVIEERIYREIHNHDVYRYIQPVYQTEILPARHFVYNTNNQLVEVSANQLPECTGAKQRWAVVRSDREKPASHTVRSAPPRRELKIISDKTYMTPEGYERRETTILHPPELEDLSDYSGPVLPIEFLHYPSSAPENELREGKKIDGLSDDGKFTMKGLGNALPAFRPGSSSSTSSHTYADSSASSPASKRLSIPRKTVGALASY